MLLMAIEIFEIATLFFLCYFGILLVEHLLGMFTIVFGIPLLITVSLFNMLLKYFKI